MITHFTVHQKIPTGKSERKEHVLSANHSRCCDKLCSLPCGDVEGTGQRHPQIPGLTMEDMSLHSGGQNMANGEHAVRLKRKACKSGPDMDFTAEIHFGQVKMFEETQAQ